MKILWIAALVTSAVSCHGVDPGSHQVRGPYSITRDSSLQVDGLPVPVPMNNGQMERLSGVCPATDRLPPENPDDPTRAFPAIDLTNRSSLPDSLGKSTAARMSRSSQHPISKRSIEGQEDDDLQMEESKVFRPLFVYRQQMENRRRAHRSRNPNYGTNHTDKSKQKSAGKHAN